MRITAKQKMYGGALLLLGCAGLLVYAVSFYVTIQVKGKTKPDQSARPHSVARVSDYSELANLGTIKDSFQELQTYFQSLAKQKGGRYAFQVLKRVQVGPNVDMHLLGHVVGDELYKQEGVAGMTACDNDFRNACSHTIVVGLFSDKGEAALPEITEACRDAPGGRGAYSMCFHGLGHGILASAGYDMGAAEKLCGKIGTPERGYSEGTECVGGAVMEIIGGGFHDRQIWERRRAQTLRADKPLALCQSDGIPDRSRFMCYEYLTPYLFEAAGANPASPTAADFKKAFTFCDALPKAEAVNRDSCYGGFGKEFDGLVQSRDIRQGAINSASDASLSQVYEWCTLAGLQEGRAACVVHAVNSLYWGGENNRDVALRFCKQNADSYLQGACMNSLIAAVGYYIADAQYRKSFCSELPTAFVGDCKRQLQVE